MDDMLSKPYTLDACAQLLRRWLPRAGQSAAQPLQPAVPHAPELAVVDTKAVASLRNLRTGAGADLYSKLVALFQTGSAETLEALDRALAQADLPAAAALCHKLKGSAANVGALVFSHELATLEKACDGGRLEEARPLYARVRGAYPVLLAELANLTLKASA